MTRVPRWLRIGEEHEAETWEPVESPVPTEIPAAPTVPADPVELPERTGRAA